MKRASEVKVAGQWNAAEAVDRVVLDAGDRQRRRIVLTGEGGTAFLLDLPQATALRTVTGWCSTAASCAWSDGQSGGPHAQGFDVVIEIDECGIITFPVSGPLNRKSGFRGTLLLYGSHPIQIGRSWAVQRSPKRRKHWQIIRRRPRFGPKQASRSKNNGLGKVPRPRRNMRPPVSLCGKRLRG
jgi:UreE urease accessory protein, N-terminal domain